MRTSAAAAVTVTPIPTRQLTQPSPPLPLVFPQLSPQREQSASLGALVFDYLKDTNAGRAVAELMEPMDRLAAYLDEIDQSTDGRYVRPLLLIIYSAFSRNISRSLPALSEEETSFAETFKKEAIKKEFIC